LVFGAAIRSFIVKLDAISMPSNRASKSV